MNDLIEFASNAKEIFAVLGGLTVAGATLLHYSTEQVSEMSLNRPVTDKEVKQGYSAYTVTKPSRASKIAKKLGL